MISYIVDEKGNKTHVVLPIDEWNNMNDNKVSKKEAPTLPIVEDSCPNKQLEKLLPLIESMQFDSVDEWQKKYKLFFRYMENLKYKDIDLLYLIRSEEFIYNINHCDDEHSLDRFSFYYQIRMLSNQDLVLSECKKIKTALFTMDDENFLKFFNVNYKIQTSKERKLRIDAEINRLFVYDLIERFPKCMELEYDITAKEAQKKLMKYLYNNKKGAKTQLQRALKQAQSQIV